MHVRARSRSHRRRILVTISAFSSLTLDNHDIGDEGTVTVIAQFTENVNATDYKDGVTCKVNSINRVINSGTRQADHRFVHFVVASALDVNDTLTLEYDDDFGDYEDDAGLPMLDISATSGVNQIGSHLFFDTEDDVVWVGAV